MSKAAPTTFSTTVEAKTLAEAQEIAARRVKDFFAGVVDGRIEAVHIDATYQPGDITYLGRKVVKTESTTRVDFEFTLVDTPEEPAPPVDQPSGTCPMTDLVCTSGCQTACRRASRFREGDIVEVVAPAFYTRSTGERVEMGDIPAGTQGEVLEGADAEGDVRVGLSGGLRPRCEDISATVLGLVRRAG